MRGGLLVVLLAAGALLASGAGSPAAPAASDEQPVAISAGSDHTCALTSLGAVKCWGVDDATYTDTGDCCDLSVTPVPKAIKDLGSGVQTMTAGGDHACGGIGGAGKCWGWNDAFQLGNPDAQDICDSEFFCHNPVDVTGLANAASFATGGAHSCAVTGAGAAECWGLNSNGEVGDGTTYNEDQPVPVSGLSSGVASLAAGDAHTCALLTNADVKCWGANGHGELGDGTTTERHAPTPVSGLHNVVQLALGGTHTCALLTGGAVKCWGLNDLGQLGDGTTTDRHTPTSVTGLTGTVSAITAGEGHTCALTTAGAVECWGANDSGQLGDGTATERYTPTPVSGLSGTVSSISAGGAHTCALLTAGTIDCWGANDDGQLGDGTTVERLLATPVLWGPVCKIPNVAKKSLADAQAALTANGCTLGQVYKAYAHVTKGNVAESLPGARSYLPQGGAVDLLVSKGKRPASKFRRPHGKSIPAAGSDGVLAADGRTAAFPVTRKGCDSIRIWRAGRRPAKVKTPCGQSGVYTLGLAGSRILWPTYDAANLIYCHLRTATRTKTRDREIPFCQGEGDDPDIEGVVGQGSVFAFNADSDVYSVTSGKTPDFVASGVTVTSVSNGRISVLEPDQSAGVYKPSGALVGRVGSGVTAAQLTGSTLWAQSGGEVTPYDVATGHSLLGGGQLQGGPFARFFDIGHGVTVYAIAGEIHLARLAAGGGHKDIALKASAADITSKGLFYSTGRRVVYVPMRSVLRLFR